MYNCLIFDKFFILDSIKVIHCFYVMVKLILNAFNIFLTLNPNWFQLILKTN